MRPSESKPFCLALILLLALNASATVYYVNVANPSPAAPYTDWSTAATNIQDAVDAASAGDQVLVTNGVYQFGGRLVSGLMTNRVAVTKSLIIQSLGGPGVTTILGQQDPAFTNGNAAVRCAYLTNGAVLAGFTLTRGATRYNVGNPIQDQCGGAVFCASSSSVVSNCVIFGNAAYGGGGGVFQGTLVNCILIGNVSTTGGGASSITLNNCTVTGNSARNTGGGVNAATLTNCTLSGNSASSLGGGAYSSSLNNCIVSSNSSFQGGGVGKSTLIGCALIGNVATDNGGGAWNSMLTNCALSRNSANYSGGAEVGTLQNCTLTGNSATTAGGGASFSTLNNCILYFNSAPTNANANFFQGTLNYCCTTPLPTNGIGNISADPELSGVSHISAASPCRGAGSAAYSTGTDIDGETWLNPPSIGCDEYISGSVTGALSVVIIASSTNVVTRFPVNLAALISGRTSGSSWDFGDGSVATNQPCPSHSWPVPGDYTITLRAWNETLPGGIASSITIHVIQAPVHYVSLSSTTPAYPYTSWATAATNIQNAVDAAAAWDLILVTNGIYQSGGRVVYGSMTNRIVVTKPLTIQSVNGPGVTSIAGFQVPGVTNGAGAVRCAYLTNGVLLSGFTLTNGATRSSGDFTNEQSGGCVWCTDIGAQIANCVITGNSAYSAAGGVYQGTLNNCTLVGNSAPFATGGAASYCILNSCILSSNSAPFGYGGATQGGTLNNCVLNGNSASFGGGAFFGTLNNCTVTGNSALSGGGIYSAVANNCIVFNNPATDGNFDPASTLNFCCTTPLPSSGTNNLQNDPQLASPWHLSATSPCRRAGSAAYTSGLDIDGETWLNPPSIGCDEYHSGSVTGPLSLAINVSYTNVLPGFAVSFEAFIAGLASGSSWDFGDGTVVSNQPYSSHAWTAPGDYPVVLTAFNETYPTGMATTSTVHVVSQQLTYYVASGNPSPSFPYNSWTTAATNVQDAVAAASLPGAVVIVSNGVYQTGSRIIYGAAANRLAVTVPLTVRSVNGPRVTVIQGAGAMRCVYLCDGAVLAGFTLANGVTRSTGDTFQEQSGGGVWCASMNSTVSNCVLIGNSAYCYGGAAFQGTLINCTLATNSSRMNPTAGSAGAGSFSSALINCALIGNSASTIGAGAYRSVLNNCVLNGNRASNPFYPTAAGGAFQSALNNCTLAYNFAGAGNAAYGGTLNNCLLFSGDAPFALLNYCCTTFIPTNGTGNFTNAPLLIDASGNFRLQTNSPCINAGNNAYVIGSTDLDGRPRIVGGTVDVGAYEFQDPGIGEFIGWLQQYGLPTDGSADYMDTDNDGMNNWQEWRAGTDPTNPNSALILASPLLSLTGSNVTLTWTSVTNRSYYLQRAPSLGTGMPTQFSLLATNIPGLPGTTSWIDTNAPAPGPAFYRVGVQ